MMKRAILIIVGLVALLGLGAALVGTRTVVVDSTTGALRGEDTNFFVLNSNALNAAVSAVGGGASVAQLTEVGTTATNALTQANNAGVAATNAVASLSTKLDSNGGTATNLTASGNFSGNGSRLTNNVAAFYTNYMPGLGDSILQCTGTNQVITLPDASTNAGRILLIHAASTTGSVILTNFNGSQTINGAMSWTVTNLNRFPTYSDGVNWQ